MKETLKPQASPVQLATPAMSKKLPQIGINIQAVIGGYIVNSPEGTRIARDKEELRGLIEQWIERLN